MRVMALIPMLFVAACGGGEEQKNVAEPKAASLPSGQWELVSEVTAFRTVDEGEPRIDTPVGTRATESVCVGEGVRPPTAFFAGEGYRCTYDNYYLRNGRLNVTLRCTREGLSGEIPVATDGTFDAESAEFNRDIRTALSTDGDVTITARVTGRRTGECAPEPEDGAEGGNQAS